MEMLLQSYKINILVKFKLLISTEAEYFTFVVHRFFILFLYNIDLEEFFCIIYINFLSYKLKIVFPTWHLFFNLLALRNNKILLLMF